MGFERFTDIVAWQLGMELHQRIIEITRRPAVARQFKFCEQLLSASSSVSANIAEGFLRYTIPEFLNYLRIAAGSLGETETRLRQGLAAGWVTDDDMTTMGPLIGRTGKAIAALRRSIQRFRTTSRKGRDAVPRT
jgi:four helix bundle protein